MMEPEQSPWICHVCDRKATGESLVCSICYRTTCRLHLRRVSNYNRQSGLYEIKWCCVLCAAEAMTH